MAKRFDTRATINDAVYCDADGEPTVNVGIDGSLSDINVDSTSIGSGGTYVGKTAAATDADFTVAYTSGTTVTFSGYPAGVSGFHADDIEFVRQIDSTGAVTATYSRDDAAMSITGDVLTVTGAVFATTDTFVVGTNVASSSTSGSSSAVGGGNNTYSNASGDFTATITNATTNITITGLPFTLEVIHVVAGSVKKIDTSDVVTNVPLTDVAVSGGVITLADADNFVTGDVVLVTLIGPDKAYDVDLDNQLTAIQNPTYAHYTDIEHIDEDNEGAQNDAKYTRHAVPMASYNYLSGSYLITADDTHNDVTLNIYATVNPDYSLPDEDTAIADSDMIFSISEEVLGNAAGITVNNASAGDLFTINTPSQYEAIIIELLYEEDNTTDPANAVDIYYKKYY